MKNQELLDKGQEAKSRSNVIPEVFYPADEANKLLDMIQPVLGEARRLAEENPGEFPIFEWFIRSFQLCYQESGPPGL